MTYAARVLMLEALTKMDHPPYEDRDLRGHARYLMLDLEDQLKHGKMKGSDNLDPSKVTTPGSPSKRRATPPPVAQAIRHTVSLPVLRATTSTPSTPRSRLGRPTLRGTSVVHVRVFLTVCTNSATLEHPHKMTDK